MRFSECIIECLRTRQQHGYQQQQQQRRSSTSISTDGSTEHYKKKRHRQRVRTYVAYVVMNCCCHNEEQQQRCHPCPCLSYVHYRADKYDARALKIFSTRNSTKGCKKIVQGARYIFKRTRSVSLACTTSARQLRLTRWLHSSVSSTTWGEYLGGSARPNAQAAAGSGVPIQGQELPAVCRQQCWRWIWSKNLLFFSRRGKTNAKARISRRLRPRPRPHRAALAVSALTSPNATRDAPPLSFLLSLQQRIPT